MENNINILAPSLWFKVKSLFAKTTIIQDISKEGTCTLKYKIVADQIYVISSEWKPIEE